LATDNNTYEKENENTKLPESGAVIGNYDSEEKYNEAINGITAEIEALEKTAEETNEWKEIRGSLNDAKDKLKALFLKDEDTNKLLDRINATFDKINQRQQEEQEKFEEESNENYEKVKEKVDEAIKKSNESEDFKQAREYLLEAQNEFKGVRLRRSQRDELYDSINAAFEKINQRQIEERENYEMECSENYIKLKQNIMEAVEFSKKSAHFGKARQALIDVQSKIKGKKLKRDQREELYQIIRDNFEDLNQRQEKDREQFEAESAKNYDNLSKIVDDAIAFASDTENYKDGREQLINAQSAIKGMKLKREQRDELYARIRKIFNELNDRQSQEREDFDKVTGHSYEKLTEKVNQCFDLVLGLDDFKMIRDSLITVQSEVKIARLKKDQRNELFARIREAFGIFDKKRDEYFSKRREEKKDKLAEAKENLVERRARLLETLDTDKAERTALNTELEKPEIDEAEKVQLEAKVAGLNTKISEKEERLADFDRRINELDEEINKVESIQEKHEKKADEREN
jgi:chromosome segregation ATPase